MNPYRESEQQPEPAEPEFCWLWHRWALLDTWSVPALGTVRLRLCRDCGKVKAEHSTMDPPFSWWTLVALQSPLIADRPSVVVALGMLRSRDEARVEAWRKRQRE